MDILNSTWLIKMLEKSSSTPHERLLSLFDILEDWLEAPNVSEHAGDLHAQEKNRLLHDFLTLEAAKAGAAMPEILANQLYFMAIFAIQSRLQANIHEGAGQDAFNHAKSAAKALIIAQTKKEFRIARSSAYAIAASFFGIFVIAASVFLHNFNAYIAPKNVHVASTTASLPALVSADIQASPQQTLALIAQIEQMRKGNCQLIEALQLPDSYKKVYFENIVLGQISTNLSDQKLVNELLQKVRCSYTPILMANSKS